ncbi:hypothetical protein CGLO_06883 [Colletotrichum gloeosporioides Cg-14]|nr:hypothetical protein CGLO_06883 [Colletotrichum gloeosporioides Cg-14]
METRQSSRSTSNAGLASPLTSPSEITSPVSSTNHPSKEEMLAFQSDPSLPALLSGSSSVSADLDVEPLVEPGVIHPRPALLETTDSLTPPAFMKEPIAGFPLEHFEHPSFGEHSGLDILRVNPSPVNRSLAPPQYTPELRPQDDEDDDSDSDEGLTMAKTKKKKSLNPTPTATTSERVHYGARRRDTNISIASTETAKKVVVHGDDVRSSWD